MKLAAIDIGSNAMRLLIIRLMTDTEQGYKKVEYVRLPLRLGDDVFKNGKLGAEKKELFHMAMQAFKLILDIHKVKNYKACATSAMREASNGDKVLKQVRKKLGMEVEVISGERESLLILRSIMLGIEPKGLFLNIDVGGGSTELTFIRNGKPSKSVSFPVGTVRLMDGQVQDDTWKELEKWVKASTKDIDAIKALGTGGNISKLYKLSGAGDNQEFMPLSRLKELYREISAMEMEERIQRMRLNPDRADVIVPAAEIYIRVMEWAGVDSIFAPPAGLKEGILLELIEEVSGKE